MRIISLILVLMFVAGCAGMTEKMVYPLPFKEDQTWKGSYVCAQGNTDLNLIIKEVGVAYASGTGAGDANYVKANFDFNYGAVTGSFLVDGVFFINSNKAGFKPIHWIQEPRGYNMVGMAGSFSADGKTFSGEISSPRCGGFTLSID